MESWGVPMKALEITATVEPAGEIRLAGLPLSAGTEVKVWISPQHPSAEEFRQEWEQVCQRLRSLPQVQQLDDAAIDFEIAEHRAGR
jgi:hypothetical protein